MSDARLTCSFCGMAATRSGGRPEAHCAACGRPRGGAESFAPARRPRPAPRREDYDDGRARPTRHDEPGRLSLLVPLGIGGGAMAVLVVVVVGLALAMAGRNKAKAPVAVAGGPEVRFDAAPVRPPPDEWREPAPPPFEPPAAPPPSPEPPPEKQPPPEKPPPADKQPPAKDPPKGDPAPPEPKPEPSGGKFSTPAATYDTYSAAVKRKDVKGMMACYTPQSRRTMSGTFALLFVVLRRTMDKGGGPPQKQFDGVMAVLDRHGLTPQATKGVNFTIDKMGQQEDVTEQTRSLLALVRNPDALLVDLFEALFKATGDDFGGGGEASLRDLRITGDKATARTVGNPSLAASDPFRKGGNNDAIHFRKVGGDWMIDVSPTR